MPFILILVSIGFLLFLIIIYNIMQQYKEKQIAAKKLTIARQRAIIDETEELLYNASRLPFSPELLALLHNRIINALNTIRSCQPTFPGINKRLNNAKKQLEQLNQTNENTPLMVFRSPDSDKEAIQILQIIKKMRAVVRSEHSKSKISTTIYIAEDRRLELMQLRVNIENAIKRANDAQAHKQYGTARQIMNKGITAVSSISDRDDYLNQRLEDMKNMSQEMDTIIKSEDVTKMEVHAAKEIDELDELFAPKKKW